MNLKATFTRVGSRHVSGSSGGVYHSSDLATKQTNSGHCVPAVTAVLNTSSSVFTGGRDGLRAEFSFSSPRT